MAVIRHCVRSWISFLKMAIGLGQILGGHQAVRPFTAHVASLVATPTVVGALMCVLSVTMVTVQVEVTPMALTCGQ